MDDIVLKGMAKWPNVPAVYGWLGLDRRGNWLLKGEKISNPTVIAFIGRNYEHDERGRWFFQNGPQRVYVALEYTPFVYRIRHPSSRGVALETHTGKQARELTGAWMDEKGSLLVATDAGIGVLHDKDLDTALSAMADANGQALGDDELACAIDSLQRGQPASLFLRANDRTICVEHVQSDDVAQRFGFVTCPRNDTRGAQEDPA